MATQRERLEQLRKRKRLNDLRALKAQQDFVPTEEALAAAQPAPQPEVTAGDVATGLGEAALTLGTGATGGALGFAAGSLGGMIGDLTGLMTQEEARQLPQDFARALTFEPRTETGRELVQAIAEPLSALPPVLAAGPQLATMPTARTLTQIGRGARGARRQGQRAIQNVSQARQAIADEIAAGNVNAGNIAKTLDADGTLITNPRTRQAMKLMGGSDAENEGAISAAINFEKMNPATRRQVGLMLDDIEANYRSGDPVQIMNNRPAKRIGDSMAARALQLDKIRKQANKELDEVIKGDLGSKPINTQGQLAQFTDDLAEAGLPVVADDAGKLSVDSSGTILNFTEVINEGKLNTLLNQLNRGQITGKDAHRLKRQLRELVSFDSTAPGAARASRDIENAVKNLASGLNDSLNQQSAAYRNANQKFAGVIDGLRKADSALGNQLLIGDELAANKFGALSKRIGTNLASREQVLDLVDTLDSALISRGIRPKDDIRRQVAALSDLEKIFKVESAQAPFGFQSRMTQAGLDVATGGQVGAAREAANFVLDRFRQMNKQDFDDKMRAARALARGNQ